MSTLFLNGVLPRLPEERRAERTSEDKTPRALTVARVHADTLANRAAVLKTLSRLQAALTQNLEHMQTNTSALNVSQHAPKMDALRMVSDALVHAMRALSSVSNAARPAVPAQPASDKDTGKAGRTSYPT